jgi:hypothetical protein
VGADYIVGIVPNGVQKCPFTGLKFFMMIYHPDYDEWLPTYGGPYDSYTIPEADDGGYMYRERYDHDDGCWKDTEWFGDDEDYDEETEDALRVDWDEE